MRPRGLPRSEPEQFEATPSSGSDGFFERIGASLLAVDLSPRAMLWSKTGTAVAWQGEVSIVDEGVVEHGLGTMLRRALGGERPRLSKAEGSGRLYLADDAKSISILALGGDVLHVSAEALLAFEGSVGWGRSPGALETLRLEGHGLVALATHGEPLTLPVTPGRPLVADAAAVVAWSDGLSTRPTAGVALRSRVAERLRAEFSGEGCVTIQPGSERLP